MNKNKQPIKVKAGAHPNRIRYFIIKSSVYKSLMFLSSTVNFWLDNSSVGHTYFGVTISAIYVWSCNKVIYAG